MLETCRTLFISDVHLGTSACQADHLLDLLEQVRPETLYLVGDIVDLEAMRKRVVLTSTQQRVVARFLELVQDGVEVIYIPGNHDAFFRRFAGQSLAGIPVRLHATHVTADGRRFHVAHGDEFDHAVHCPRALAMLGDWLHGALLSLNRWLNGLRRLMGFPYWSLAGYLKAHVGKAQAFIRRYEEAVLKEARHRQLDGYICGHIHVGGFRQSEEGILYCNDGDWVEHCTALVEDRDGQLSLWHWSESPRCLAREPGGCRVPEPASPPVFARTH
ncbi:MAG: UDP-2,3-diacylglucosamine diphosphatase [Gammaproteobacteria bacterium]|nr:MAG: UDP-2,3-diacylglucosamine diphosphatase [Gammaproteobacteria bacterium]